MRTYDITLTISPDLVVWPDDLPVELYKTDSIANGSQANVSRIHMGVHTGTHVDAPYHFIDGGKTVDMLDVAILTGRAYSTRCEVDWGRLSFCSNIYGYNSNPSGVAGGGNNYC
ncbi:MAG: cyclase family protein [Anaerolineales bacterium]